MRKKNIFFSLIVLIAIFIWPGILPDSIEKAIDDKGWSDIFLIEQLDGDSALVFMEEDTGKIRIASVHKGFFGWKVVDYTGLLSVNDNVDGFSGMAGTLTLDENELHFLMGIIKDQDIDKMTYKSSQLKQEKLINTFTTKKGTRIYYAINEAELSDVRYVAYSDQGEVLYRKP
ncbi:MAG: hypothetical protein H0Z33_13130 [Bacillaceae bacterium]|nr:hypothetical protein [Bacillaceae bacterium]